jgi:hypothetical protein
VAGYAEKEYSMSELEQISEELSENSATWITNSSSPKK